MKAVGSIETILLHMKSGAPSAFINICKETYMIILLSGECQKSIRYWLSSQNDYSLVFFLKIILQKLLVLKKVVWVINLSKNVEYSLVFFLKIILQKLLVLKKVVWVVNLSKKLLFLYKCI